jgi:hypothetical protein
MPAFDVSAFDRAIEPVVGRFTTDQARLVAEHRGDDSLQARIEQLSEKSNEGTLTENERDEYAGYVQANKFVAILQAQVRKLLERRQQ